MSRPAVVLAASALVLASCAASSSRLAPAAATPVRSAVVLDEGRQLWRGAGMALAWEANRLYGSARMRPDMPSPLAQARYMDLLFGNPSPGDGLGLNIARYNIGGGADPDPRPCRADPGPGLMPSADMEGFRPDPAGPYDWRRDASQRRMLAEAIRRGADIVDAFSNSAPWWMTASLCVAGADRPRQDNLPARSVVSFADYLATVTRRFAAGGIRFDSVSPVNEPDGSWWVAGNHQEGSYATLPTQSAAVRALASDLGGTATIVSGTEPNDFDRMTGWLDAMDPATLAALGRIDVHQYDGRDPGALHLAAERLGKPLWASEVGCCIVPLPPAEAALRMADWIRQAMVELGAEAWCFWQPDWGVIAFDDGWPRPLRQFDAIAQFTRYIRPGDRILAVAGDEIAAAATPDGRRLVAVVINAAGRPVEEELRFASPFARGVAARVVRTVTTDADGLRPEPPVPVDGAGVLRDREPARSITTYVVEASGSHAPAS